MVRSLVVLFALVGCPSPDPEPPTDTGTKDRYTPPDTGSPDDARPGDSADSADTGTADPTRLLGGPPLSTAEPTFRQRDHGLNPNFRWLDGSPPLPTNAWWQNLVLGPGTQRVYPLPYQVRADNDGLHVCFPRETATATVVFSSFADDLVLGAVEAPGNRAVTAHDLLSVTLTWTSGTRRLITPLVRGAPYVTAEYVDHTPVLRSQHGIVAVEATSGTRAEVSLGNGSTWAVYTSSEVPWALQDGVLTAQVALTGTLRVAVLGSAGDEAVLDAHASRIPTGGEVTATAAGDEAELVFDWQTTGTGELLMMQLPHHESVLTRGTTTELVRDTLKGPMVGVIGDTWTMREALTMIGFEAPSGIRADRREAVREALAADVGLRVRSGDPYFGGKELALLGRHALIADELGEAKLARTYRDTLAAALEPWLSGSNGQPLVYDRTWGGIVLERGLSDPGASFGQGYYNDHHFHYGYHLYAAAALAKGDPAWAAEWGDEVTDLLRDIANPSADDPHFTVTRNKDWFVGHSWAAGLFEFADARNQESTSEAVNAWYAVSLWGRAIGDDRIRDLGRLMLGTELRATWRYWQVEDDDGIYPTPFADNHVVGILWSTKVEYTTFFGSRPEFIHGIQWLPFTPITEELLRPAWMAQAYPVVQSALDQPGLEEGWRGFIYMAHGVLDPDTAWTQAQGLVGYDNGNSRTNTRYWLATRPE